MEAVKTTPQQYFRVKPHDTEVGQGGSVVIPCEVGDRRGRVQWTKDGLTLGKRLFFQMSEKNKVVEQTLNKLGAKKSHNTLWKNNK